ncbi:MAG: prepilin-type N-terminal cleavage/methylation domain-containing protein [Gemmatimonadota bacterium]
MHRTRTGFTMIELIIAIVIGSILTTIALNQISGAQTRIAVRGAQTTYASIHYRARVHGIEKGHNVMLHVDVTGDSVWIEDDGDIIETIRFGDENIDMTISSPSTLTQYMMCFSPRGYTDTGCNTSNALIRMHFEQGSEIANLWVFPLGQLLLDQ